MHARGRRDGAIGVVGLGNRCAKDRHDGVTDELHHRAALAEDGLVHGGAMGIELARELTWIGVLGNGGIGTDVAHDHGHLHALSLADATTLQPYFFGDASGQQTRQRLTLLFAVNNGQVQQP